MGWYILGILLLLLALLLWTKLTVRLLYDQELHVFVEAWGLKVDVLKLANSPKKDKPPKAKKTKKKAAKKAKEKESPPIGERVEKVFNLVKSLLPPAVQSLLTFHKRLRMERLKLHIVVGTDDPAVTGMVYGGICASMNGFLSLMDSMFHIKEKDVYVEPDFCGGESGGVCDLIFSIRVVNLLEMVMIFGYTYVKGLVRNLLQNRPVKKRKHVNHG